MSAKPLGTAQLDPQELKADRKTIKRYDQCGLGAKAAYVPSKMTPRKFYIPYDNLERVFKRVAVSPGSGKAFLTPVLYLVFLYDGGQEKQVYFKYLKDADELFNQLEREHPEIPLVSASEEAKINRELENEASIQNVVLDRPQAAAVRDLENAEELLSMRPALYKELAGAARLKRSMDLIKPAYQVLAVLLVLAGLGCLGAGAALMMTAGKSSLSIILMLAGIALVFVMINSGILPAPKKNKGYANKEYQRTLENMRRSLKRAPDFPVPAEYAHPFTLRRMVRLIKLGRATNTAEALEELKKDLKAANSEVALKGEEYKQVIAIKPLFTVNEYR